jgi:hypothetical protein
MIDLLEILYNQFHNKSKIYLTWDAASWHGSQELVEWANERNAWNDEKDSGPTIAFVPLPSSAQFLDVIEAVFSAMKRAVIHGSDYQSEEEMKMRYPRILRKGMPFLNRIPDALERKYGK